MWLRDALVYGTAMFAIGPSVTPAAAAATCAIAHRRLHGHGTELLGVLQLVRDAAAGDGGQQRGDPRAPACASWIWRAIAYYVPVR